MDESELENVPGADPSIDVDVGLSLVMAGTVEGEFIVVVEDTPGTIHPAALQQHMRCTATARASHVGAVVLKKHSPVMVIDGSSGPVPRL